MALIKCPECKKKVSDQCGNCPHCGYPIALNAVNDDTVSETNEISSAVQEGVNTPILNECTIQEEISAQKKPINKKLLIAIICAAVVVLSIGSVIGYKALLPRINATKEFKTAVQFVESKNVELDKVIAKSEALIAEKPSVLDDSFVTLLETAISEAKSAKITNFKKPSKVDDIISRTNELNKTDYSKILTNVKEKHTALEIDIKRMKQVTCPSESFVLQRITNIRNQAGITDFIALTEDNDPENYIGKAGWYTAKVVFRHKDAEHYGLENGLLTLSEVGNPAGGCIEVFRTVEDVQRRADSLKALEGTSRSPGARKICGTVLIRVSDNLKTSYQQELLDVIYAELIRLDGVDKTTPATEPDTTTTNASTTTTTTKNDTSNDNKNQQAVKSAKEIADYYATVYPNMVKELLMDDYGFTETQANYAVKNAGIDWNYYAVIHLEEYAGMNGDDATKSKAERHLSEYGYTDAAIQYAFKNADIDWRTTDEKNADKTPTTASAAGTYIGRSSECTFSLILNSDGTVTHKNDTANFVIYHGTWVQQGSKILFTLQFQDFEEVEYYNSTLYSDGMQFMDFYYTRQ